MKSSPSHKGQPISSDARNNILVLTASTLREFLTPALCLEALEEMYANLHDSPKDGGQSLGFETSDGKIHVKSGLSPKTHQYFAAKINANYPRNFELFGLPTIQGISVLVDCLNGSPVAILHSGVLTGIRTAAATALATKYGARKNASSVAIFGCGEQAKYHAEAICAIRDIKNINVFETNTERGSSFCQWVRRSLKVEAALKTSAEEALVDCDICITVTTSTRPIFAAEAVPSGCFIAAVGADNPDKQEIDPSLFAKARIVVDDSVQCFSYGDLAHACRAGIVAEKDIDATLAELAAGVKNGRVSDDEIVIFDSTGVGVQDVAASAAVYKAARKLNIGNSIDLNK